MDDSTLLSKNALLQVLHDGERTPLENIKLVNLRTPQATYEADQPMQNVYFPIDLVIAVVTTLVDGTSVKVGSIGIAGTTGIFTALGATTVPNATFAKQTADAS